MPAPENVSPICCKKPQAVSQASLAGPGRGQAGVGGGGHRSLNTRPSQGRSIAQAALGRSSGQEATSQRTQLWPVLGRGPCLGGFLVRACSQAAGRWSPLWASAQEVAFIECLLCARHRGRVTDQITPTPGIGPRSSWQEKQLLITCGFPGAPRLQPAGMRRGVFGAFFPPPNPLPTHGSIWESGQPKG